MSFQQIVTGSGLNQLTGLSDVDVTSHTDKSIISWNATASKYQEQTAINLGLCTLSNAQTITGQKSFANSLTNFTINSSSPTVPLSINNALGWSSLQLNSGAANAYITNSGSIMSLTNATDFLPSIKIDKSGLVNTLGRSGYEVVI